MKKLVMEVVRTPEEALAALASDPALLQTLAQVRQALRGIRHTEPLLERLLDEITGSLPVERAAILLADRKTSLLEPAAYRPAPFDVDRAFALRAFQEKKGILRSTEPSALCVPLGFPDQGVIYLENPKADAFTPQHLALLLAIATEVAAPLDYTRYIDSLEGENQELRAYAHVDHGLVGQSRAIADVRTFIDKVAGKDSTVLILGEMGTGKDLVARAIHRRSLRAAGPFVAINCAAIPETLIESELFGHERGAFSGAVALKKGKVEVADGGTLFLDEVGELKPQMQASLLRFLQEGEFQRVGGTRTLHSDVRLVAATNRNLQESIHAGEFRGDLYYRLSVIECRTPSLRQMREDIPRLAMHFIEERRYLRVVNGITPEALRLLTDYDWPGNVRHLQNVIEQALVLGSAPYIDVEDLPDTISQASASDSSMRGYHQRLRAFTKAMLADALAESRGNYAEAARVLALSPSYLRRLARDLNVQ